ncbi:MAG: universal stress protein [Chloroflexota bacterium]
MSDDSTPPQGQAIQRIILALGLSRYGEAKLGVAATLARALGAELLLLHVVTASPRPEGEVSLEESQANAYLDAVAAGLRATGVEAQSLVRYGPIADTVVAEAEAHAADLVVLGRSVHHGLINLFSSTVADEVAARLTCPTVLVPADPQEALPVPGVRSFDADAALAGPVAPRVLGSRVVSLERIVGSVGRARELDESFRPRNPSFAERQRYDRVYEAMHDGISLPPPALYKLGYGYYVLDGNHRVAAAKRLGFAELEAEVTEYVPLEDPQTLRVFNERRAFERITGITRIGAALPGHYSRLEGMVREYAQAEGLVDLREAGRLWQAKVYRPLARRIRVMRLGHCFPGERTADIFVRVAALRAEEEERTGQELPWDAALTQLCRLSGGV